MNIHVRFYKFIFFKKCSGSYQGLQATAPNTGFYSHGQDNLPVVLNESDLGTAFNGPNSQFDLSLWIEAMKPDKGTHQIRLYQAPVPSEQSPFTGGPGIESFTFDEVYNNGLSIKDVDGDDTDGETPWQVLCMHLCIANTKALSW